MPADYGLGRKRALVYRPFYAACRRLLGGEDSPGGGLNRPPAIAANAASVVGLSAKWVEQGTCPHAMLGVEQGGVFGRAGGTLMSRGLEVDPARSGTVQTPHGSPVHRAERAAVAVADRLNLSGSCRRREERYEREGRRSER
jgi:hypothetical protein